MVVTLLKPRWPEFADRLNGLTTLEPNPASPEAAAGVNVPPLLAVVSGHLKAGFTSAKRRLQQVSRADEFLLAVHLKTFTYELDRNIVLITPSLVVGGFRVPCDGFHSKMFKGLDALRKKLVIVQKGQKRPRKVGVMVCGDFNSGGRTAVRELLTKGEIHKEFREFDDGADEVWTSKPTVKTCLQMPLEPWLDSCCWFRCRDQKQWMSRAKPKPTLSETLETACSALWSARNP